MAKKRKSAAKLAKMMDEESLKTRDRYELSLISRDRLRKVLTQLRKEEARIANILQMEDVASKFTEQFENRASRKEAVKTKARLINEIMRIEKSIARAGENGEKAIKADQRLSDTLTKRGIKNDASVRRSFVDFMQAVKSNFIGKLPPSDDALDFFEQHGAGSRAEDFIEDYTDFVYQNERGAL